MTELTNLIIKTLHENAEPILTINDVLKTAKELGITLAIQATGCFMFFDVDEETDILDWTELVYNGKRVYWDFEEPIEEQNTDTIEWLNLIIKVL